MGEWRGGGGGEVVQIACRDCRGKFLPDDYSSASAIVADTLFAGQQIMEPLQNYATEEFAAFIDLQGGGGALAVIAPTLSCSLLWSLKRSP